MFTLRSLIGFSLSILLHGGIAAYVLTQDFEKDSPKPKKISMQLSMFKIAPLDPAKPLAVKLPVPKPVVIAPKETFVAKVATVATVATPTVKPIKPEPLKIVSKPVIKKASPKLVKPNPLSTKTRTKKPKNLKKELNKKKRITKQRITPKKAKRITQQQRNQQLRKAQHQKARILAQQRARANAQAKARAKARTEAKRKAVAQTTSAKPIAKKKQTAKKRVPQPPIKSNPHLERQYGQGIRQRIEQKKKYPRRAKRMRKQGTVKVGFTVNKNGTLSNLRITQTSGTKSLDTGALRAVKAIGRFPSFPIGINKQYINYIIPISFSLR